jgi:tRNA(Arg) A34 adenosine deaminase TadA
MKVKYFAIAKKLSNKVSYHHKIGAVVVWKNRPIGMGWNDPFKTSPRSNNPYFTIHAELRAIINAGDCKGADIYIFREFKDGTLANSKPCMFCQQLLKEAGIKNVYYTSNGGYEKYEQ